jgi:ferredoxin-thioredoxin reductase catalytic chain
MRERHECHCMLFLTEENDFAGSETVVTVEEVQKLSGGFSS